MDPSDAHTQKPKVSEKTKVYVVSDTDTLDVHAVYSTLEKAMDVSTRLAAGADNTPVVEHDSWKGQHKVFYSATGRDEGDQPLYVISEREVY